VIRFGLIGYGAWGRHHADAIAAAPGARLAAIACATAATAAAARRDFPDVPVHLDYRDLLARADVDAVDIVVPNHLHAEVGVAALERGKDVLLEKPMACTALECDALIAAAARAGRVLSIGHELRLSAQWGRVKTLIDAGDIGEPLYALFELFRFPYRRGAGGWRYQRARVGSWILEEPVHAFDFALWYFEDAGDPISVSAIGNGKGREEGMYDNVSAIVRFPGGRHAVVTQTLAAFEYHQVVEVVGTEGAVRGWWSGALDRTLEPRFELKAQRRGQSAPEVIPIERSGEVFELRAQLARTAAAFEARRPLVTGEEARKRVILCREAERSIVEGREIALSLAAAPGSPRRRPWPVPPP
jgi:myo-inositol 2-dehydrogenase/D-chiro-inositol 1-dehydrogenase